MGDYLTQVTPICSVRPGGRLAAHAGRVEARFATEDACRISTADLVSRDVVGVQSEDRHERPVATAGVETGQLQDREDVTAHVASGHGLPWPRK